MARYQRPVLNYDASTVWAAASLAQRVNGTYVKALDLDPQTGKPVNPNQKINRDLMKDAIANPSVITDEDRKAGEDARTYYKGLTFKILQGKTLSEFDNSAMMIANRDNITSGYDIAVIAALPSCYLRATARDNMDRRINMAKGGLIGRVGDKVVLDLEIVRVIFSNNYGVFFVTGITADDKPVFFAYKEKLTVGVTMKFKGTVKAHRDMQTQLNRVKAVV
jgi:hypothetical protein